jgi:hypothetical protein
MNHGRGNLASHDPAKQAVSHEFEC